MSKLIKNFVRTFSTPKVYFGNLPIFHNGKYYYPPEYKTFRSTESKFAAQLIIDIRSRDYDAARNICVLGDDVRSGYLIKTVDTYMRTMDRNDDENTALTDAAKRGDVNGILTLVLELKANLGVYCGCPDKKTPLHYTAEYGHIAAMRTLLDLGARFDELDAKQRTPLALAKEKNKIEIVNFLNNYQSNYKPQIFTNGLLTAA